MLLKNTLPKVLICDDDKNLHLAIKAALGNEFDIKSAYHGDEACVILKNNRFDIVLMDMEIRHASEGLDTIPKLIAIQDDLEVIFFSGQTNFDFVRRAMQVGAVDYVSKDSGADELRHAFNRVMDLKTLKDKNKKSSLEVKKTHKNNILIGNSPAIQNLKKLTEKARKSPAPVIIYGETGTGKEVVARLLRKTFEDGTLEPFVAVDSSTIQSSVAESMLFGYEKGAFTGADKSTPGLFEEANGGTIYFDELANMPLDIQNKLLRVIQEKEVMRIGSAKAIHLDFRVIAATNQNLEELIKQGKFKEDLYQRIAVLQISIPPLRERKDDITELLAFFSETQSMGRPKLNFLPETIKVIQDHAFTGNVRELSNLVMYLYTLMDNTDVSPLDLPPKFFNRTSDNANQTDASNRNFYKAVENFERKFLNDEYKSSEGNVSRMAQELGMDRSYLHSKLKNFGIHTISKK